jgi:lambda family phage portal protein
VIGRVNLVQQAARDRAAARRAAAPPRGRGRQPKASYEGASTARRTFGWRSPTVSPNAGILPNLTLLRDRSRAATRNDGYAKGVIDKLVSNIVGTGIKPLSQADDPAFRQRVHALWLQWTDESDAEGLLDYYGQQSQAVRGWQEGGEVFVRLRPRLPEDGLSVPLQLQLVEPELCPHGIDRDLPNGNRIRAAIEFNRIGRRVAFWFHPSRPGDPDDYDVSQLRRIPAERVIHLFDPLRPGQLRGVPKLTQALVKLYELDKFDDATLLRQQIANLFVGFIKKPSTSTADTQIDPLTGKETDTSLFDRPMISLEPGLFQEMDPGDEIEFSDPPDVGQTYPDFMRQQLFAVAAATGVPYEVLTGDMSKVNDRTVRVILHEFRRAIQAWQHQIVAFQFCRRVFNAWMDQAFLSGALPIPVAYVENPTPWNRVSWMPQSWPYLHPVQDVEADRAAVRSGFTTRAAVVSERGEDVEAIDRQQAEDNQRADNLGVKYDSDGRHPVSGSATPAPAPAEEGARA